MHRQEEGATAVEYGLVAGVMGIVFVLAGPQLWQALLSLLDAVLTAILG
jgi:Flp pilus assembly pilin Flp